MYNDQYFDQLSVCDNDIDFLFQMIQLIFPNISRDEIHEMFPSDTYHLHDILSLNYNSLENKDIIGNKIAVFLKMLRVFADKYNRSSIKKKNIINNSIDLIEYLKNRFIGLKNEYLLLILLDSKNFLINEQILSVGTPNFVSVSIEKIIQMVYQNHASAFLIVHNHPSGDPTPSQEDINISIKLQSVCDHLSINFHDHIIVGAYDTFSLRNSGLI